MNRFQNGRFERDHPVPLDASDLSSDGPLLSTQLGRLPPLEASLTNKISGWSLSMKKRFMRLAASVGLVVALAIGTILMFPSEASASPCGLSYQTVSSPGGTFKVVYYTIRN